MAEELNVLDPAEETITLSTGTVVSIEPLKTRQFFKLLRIVTRGALPSLQDMSLFKIGQDMDASEFAGRLLSLLLLSIPEAENEAIDFVQAMCRPVGLIERRSGAKLSKPDIARNTDLWAAVITDLDNPELDDLVTVIEAVVHREAGDLVALGKRLSAMFKLAEKTGQVPSGRRSRSSQGVNISVGSHGLSTSSVTNTGGGTLTYSTYLSDASDSVSPPSPNDGSSSSGNASSG